jgi:hypothetical protein
MRTYHIRPDNPNRLFVSNGHFGERPKLKRSGWVKIRCEDARQILGTETYRRIVDQNRLGTWFRTTAITDGEHEGEWIHEGQRGRDYPRGAKIW